MIKKLKQNLFKITYMTLILGGSTMTLANSSSQMITKKSELTFNKAPRNYFSGNAQFAYLPKIDSSKDNIAIVEFEANAITNWHIHSEGQYLIVIEGEGRTQEWSKDIQVIKKGDIIWCPPGVKHWHGAGEKTSMKHIAMAPNADSNKVTWLEKVELTKENTQDEYLKKELIKHMQTSPLSEKQLSMAPIAAANALGDIEKLKQLIANGLNKGLTINEIKEIFAHQYAYAGFPRALNGVATLNEVLKERTERGIKDIEGENITLDDADNYYEIGTNNLNILNQRDNSAILWNFDGIDYALKAHLFGYLFSRKNLSFINRELTTISTLASLDGVDGQLNSHLNINKNLGLDKTEINKIIQTLGENNLQKSAENMKRVLEKNN